MTASPDLVMRGQEKLSQSLVGMMSQRQLTAVTRREEGGQGN